MRFKIALAIVSVFILASCSSGDEPQSIRVGFAKKADIKGTDYLAISDVSSRAIDVNLDKMLLRVQGSGEVLPLKFDFTYSLEGDFSEQDTVGLEHVLNGALIRAEELSWIGSKYILMSGVRVVLPCGHEVYDWCDDFPQLVHSAVSDLSQYVKPKMLLRVSDGALFDFEGIDIEGTQSNHDGTLVYGLRYDGNPEERMIVKLSDEADNLLITEIASYHGGMYYLDRNDNILIADGYGQYLIRYADGGIDELPLPAGDQVAVFEYEYKWYASCLTENPSDGINTVDIYAYSISGKSVSYDLLGSYTSTYERPLHSAVIVPPFAVDDDKFKVRLYENVDNNGFGGGYIYHHIVVDPLARTVTSVSVPEEFRRLDQSAYIWDMMDVYCTFDKDAGLIKRYTYGTLTIEEVPVDRSLLPALQSTEDSYNSEMDSFVMYGVGGETVVIDAKTGKVTVIPADEHVSISAMRRIN